MKLTAQTIRYTEKNLGSNLYYSNRKTETNNSKFVAEMTSKIAKYYHLRQ